MIASWSMEKVHGLMVAGPSLALKLARCWGLETDDPRRASYIDGCGLPWELYVAHATNQSYAAHLVPRPCAEKLSGDCLPAACAD